MGEVRRAILFITFVGIALFVSTCAKKEPVEEGRCKLKYKAVSNHEDIILAVARRYLVRTAEKPIELKDLPQDLTPDYVYFPAEVFDTNTPIPLSTAEKSIELKDLPQDLNADYVYFLAEVFDTNTPIILSSVSKLVHSMLYVDTNGNGRLSDEKAYRPKITKRPRSNRKEYKFGPILMKSQNDGKSFETKFYATTYGFGLYLHPAGYRVGKIRLGKKTYKVAVSDSNLDGRYDKIFSLPIRNFYPVECDIFAIDLNNSGKKWRLSLDQPSEIMPLGRMLKVRNTYYGINVAPDGTALELKKVEPEFGTLDFDGDNVKVNLWSDAGNHYLFGSEGSCQLPVGLYSALFVELNKLDSEQNAWTFTSYRDTGTLRDFKIHAGRTTSFKVGSPFTIKMDVRQVADQLSIGLKLEGCAGVQYRFPVLKGGRRQPAPTFKIVNESGKVLASGQFKYG